MLEIENLKEINGVEVSLVHRTTWIITAMSEDWWCL